MSNTGNMSRRFNANDYISMIDGTSYQIKHTEEELRVAELKQSFQKAKELQKASRMDKAKPSSKKTQSNIDKLHDSFLETFYSYGIGGNTSLAMMCAEMTIEFANEQSKKMNDIILSELLTLRNKFEEQEEILKDVSAKHTEELANLNSIIQNTNDENPEFSDNVALQLEVRDLRVKVKELMDLLAKKELENYKPTTKSALETHWPKSTNPCGEIMLPSSQKEINIFRDLDLDNTESVPEPSPTFILPNKKPKPVSESYKTLDLETKEDSESTMRDWGYRRF